MIEPIAIVGRACVLPGALTPEQLWEVVSQGRDMVSSVDPGRWRVDPSDVSCSPDEPRPDRTWTDRGGYVRGFDHVWDPEGFCVPAAELAGLDPLAHWVLHCAREALADAGDGRRGSVERSKVAAVFGNLGFPTNEMSRYAERLWLGDALADGDDQNSGGNPLNRFMSGGTANLLERALGLMPGVTCLDTACASSLYAIKLACDLLRDRRADRVLAGAVNRADDLFLHVGFAALSALSRTGQSRPFHAEADGLLPAEGAGFVTLERLSDARAAGRTIYGIIRGVGLSNDGHGHNFLAPDQGGQQRAMEQAYAKAAVDPSVVSLLECHATGTVVGDATELRSAAAVFEGAEDVPIGSLKSNLGHTITAAGIAGLIKVLEAMRHGQRPPSLHVDGESQSEMLAQTPFRVVTKLESWDGPQSASGRRVAGISAFGFGGNNAHLVVSEDDPKLVAAPHERAEQVPLAIVGLGTLVGNAGNVEAFEQAVMGNASLGPSSEHAFELRGIRFPPNDLRRTLPQQLLLLSAAREAARRSSGRTFDREGENDRTGVFVGLEPDPEICRNGARWRIPQFARANGANIENEEGQAWVAATRDAIAPSLEAATVVGTMPNIPANRINAHFDLGGPSWSVFGSESSGRHALALACRALRENELDCALVGAVDLSCQEVHEAALAAIEGKSERAGDAAIAFVLKRLDDAEREGDTIWAVVDGGAEAVGQDDAQVTLDPEDPNPERGLGLRARFGRCFAAGDLRDLTATVLAGRRGVLPDGRAWPKPSSGGQRSMRVAAGSASLWVGDSFSIRPVPARPDLIPFGGANAADLKSAIANGHIAAELSNAPARAMVLANGPSQLSERVARASRALDADARKPGVTNAGPGVFLGESPIRGGVAFVFNGAGAAYPGMGAELAAALPELTAAVRAKTPLLASYFDRPWPGEDAATPPLQRLWAASYLCQLHAKLSTEVLGLRPDAVIGYSSGESNSLFATGIWTDHDDMVRACEQSDVFTRQIGGEFEAVALAWETENADWETWTVLAPVAEIEKAIAAQTREAGPARARITVVHHDGEAIVGGDPRACAGIKARLPGVRWLRLHYDLAVHTPELATISEAWLALHRRPVQPRADLRVYSGAHSGAYAPSTEACAQAILGQADRPLDFRRVIEQAYADGIRVFIEHGPRAACTRWIREILGEREAVVVALDRPGHALDALLEATAALVAAGIDCDLGRLRASLNQPMQTQGPTLSVVAHPPPIQIPRLPAQRAARVVSPTDSHTSPMPMQSMSPAPHLPPVDAIAPPLAAGAPSMPAVPVAQDLQVEQDNPLAAAYREQLTALAQNHQQFVHRQLAMHQQFLALQAQGSVLFGQAASSQAGLVHAPQAQVPVAQAFQLPPPPATVVSESVRPAVSAPKPNPPRSAATPTPSKPAGPDPTVPTGPTFDRQQLEIHAGGRISEIFGPEFAIQDGFERQVRMPEPPLLLADRVTGLAAEPMSMKLGSIWTETDVKADAWYVHAARMPAGIMIESGQADLMLISYLGVDAENKGERIYRLLGCSLTYHGGLPEVGETLCYDIHLDGHAKQGGIRLMFFHYDCQIDGKPRLSVRKGQAGFFTDEELAASDGCLWKPEDQEIVETPRLDPPALRSQRSTFDKAQVAAFAEGRPWGCFGPEWFEAKPHTRTPSITGGNLLFFDAVDRFEIRGGPWERGYLSASCAIEPDHWFFDGHFHNDPCMPGTLMYEGCLQAMAFFLAGLGYTVARDGWRFEPVKGEPFDLSCRGQVTPTSKNLRYEVFVEEVIAGPIPTLYADLLCTVDGLKAFHARRVGVSLVPDWPLEESHPQLDGYEGEPHAVAKSGDFAFDFPSMLACAQGRPTTAFGPIYERFDGAEPVARLPNPPYHFISRANQIDAEVGAMRSGMSVELEYDIPPDAWYLAENGCRVVPFAVLLEAALQPCGWLASYMGCALSSEQALMFRNLDGTGTIHAELREDAGTLRTKVVNTRLSKTASMIIVGFEVECRTDDALIYSLDTVFGFFPATAFENQAGLPTTPEQMVALEAPSNRETRLDGGASTPGRARMARPMLLMLDGVSHFEPEGGAAGLGVARAEKRVDASEWFFKAHFFQDPVQPGSLGIEAMLQLLQWTMLELGMDADMVAPRFEAIAVGDEHSWKYRGQVVPKNEVITTTLEITSRGTDERGAFAFGDLSLWVDGKRIYEAPGLGMRIVDDGADELSPVGDGRCVTLDPAVDRWIGDHCPTYTVPALPMMSMVDLMASAVRDEERLLGLRDLRVKGWVVVDQATHFRCERDRDQVRLFVDEAEGEREVATGRLIVGRRYPPAPKAAQALEGPQLDSPYESGQLFHGPAFQLLESLIRSSEGVSSVLRAESEVPLGRINPALLDAATHGIEHDQLREGKIAYPAWIPEIEFFGPTPTGGDVRCEVRPAGHVGSPDFPAHDIQLIGPSGSVWCRFKLVEACFPKGRLGLAAPEDRRAFLRDHRAVEGLGLTDVGSEKSTLSIADVEASDWLPGTVRGIYGSREAAEIAQKEHIAAAHGLHPRQTPTGLPLTRFELGSEEHEGLVTVTGDPRGTLDITPVREFWTKWFARGSWPVEDLYYGLIERFVDRVVIEDPEAFEQVRGRSVLYLGNHQVAVESLLFSVIASALSEVPTVTLAKIEHEGTWLGRLIEHSFSYPGIRDPKLITFFDRSDKDSLAGVIQEFAAEMHSPGRSVMVHVEGTRAMTCAKPVEKMSGAFLDMAIAVDAPVVPIRFVGGLPVRPFEERVEFPMGPHAPDGMGRQSIWIGRPILAKDLAPMHYGARKELVIESINRLGGPSVDERPLPGDPEFAERVLAWQRERGVGHEHAALREILAERLEAGTLGDEAKRLLTAENAAALASDQSPEGKWLAELARRLLG